MKTIETKVYTFDELPEEAKEKARSWYLEAASSDLGQWEYDDIKLDAENVGLKIEYGDFIGSAPECAEKILSEHGKDCETYKTAKEYLEEKAMIGDRPSETVEDADDSKWEDETGESDQTFLTSLLEDYRIMYEKNMEYRQSNEAVDDDIRANEYTFTGEGERFG